MLRHLSGSAVIFFEGVIFDFVTKLTFSNSFKIRLSSFWTRYLANWVDFWTMLALAGLCDFMVDSDYRLAYKVLW